MKRNYVGLTPLVEKVNFYLYHDLQEENKRLKMLLKQHKKVLPFLSKIDGVEYCSCCDRLCECDDMIECEKCYEIFCSQGECNGITYCELDEDFEWGEFYCKACFVK